MWWHRQMLAAPDAVSATLCVSSVTRVHNVTMQRIQAAVVRVRRALQHRLHKESLKHSFVHEWHVGPTTKPAGCNSLHGISVSKAIIIICVVCTRLKPWHRLRALPVKDGRVPEARLVAQHKLATPLLPRCQTASVDGGTAGCVDDGVSGGDGGGGGVSGGGGGGGMSVGR